MQAGVRPRIGLAQAPAAGSGAESRHKHHSGSHQQMASHYDNAATGNCTQPAQHLHNLFQAQDLETGRVCAVVLFLDLNATDMARIHLGYHVRTGPLAETPDYMFY